MEKILFEIFKFLLALFCIVYIFLSPSNGGTH